MDIFKLIAMTTLKHSESSENPIQKQLQPEDVRTVDSWDNIFS